MSFEQRLQRVEQTVGGGVCPQCHGYFVDVRGLEGNLTGPCCPACGAPPVCVVRRLTVAELEAM